MFSSKVKMNSIFKAIPKMLVTLIVLIYHVRNIATMQARYIVVTTGGSYIFYLVRN